MIVFTLNISFGTVIKVAVYEEQPYMTQNINIICTSLKTGRNAEHSISFYLFLLALYK